MRPWHELVSLFLTPVIVVWGTIFLVGALRTGVYPTRRKDIARKESPFLFWFLVSFTAFVFLFYSILGVVFTVHIVFEMLQRN